MCESKIQQTSCQTSTVNKVAMESSSKSQLIILVKTFCDIHNLEITEVAVNGFCDEIIDTMTRENAILNELKQIREVIANPPKKVSFADKVEIVAKSKPKAKKTDLGFFSSRSAKNLAEEHQCDLEVLKTYATGKNDKVGIRDVRKYIKENDIQPVSSDYYTDAEALTKKKKKAKTPKEVAKKAKKKCEGTTQNGEPCSLTGIFELDNVFYCSRHKKNKEEERKTLSLKKKLRNRQSLQEIKLPEYDEEFLCTPPEPAPGLDILNTDGVHNYDNDNQEVLGEISEQLKSGYENENEESDRDCDYGEEDNDNDSVFGEY